MRKKRRPSRCPLYAMPHPRSTVRSFSDSASPGATELVSTSSQLDSSISNAYSIGIEASGNFICQRVICVPLIHEQSGCTKQKNIIFETWMKLCGMLCFEGNAMCTYLPDVSQSGHYSTDYEHEFVPSVKQTDLAQPEHTKSPPKLPGETAVLRVPT